MQRKRKKRPPDLRRLTNELGLSVPIPTEPLVSILTLSVASHCESWFWVPKVNAVLLPEASEGSAIALILAPICDLSSSSVQNSISPSRSPAAKESSLLERRRIAPSLDATSRSLAGTALSRDPQLIPNDPPEETRTLSVPDVSIVNVSAAGNLIAVFVSPVWR